MKRGQVTLFIILGILIISALALTLYFKEEISEAFGFAAKQESIAVSKEAKKMQGLVKGCLKQTVEKGIITIGKQGGKNAVTRGYSDTKFNTNYLYANNRKRFYRLSDLEKELSTFIDRSIGTCMQSSKIMTKPKTQAKITKGQVTLTTDWPITVELGKTKETLSVFKQDVKVNLDSLYSVTNSVLDEVAKEELCVSCIARHGELKNIDVVVDVVDDKMLFTLEDAQTILNSTTPKMIFAVNKK